MSTRPSYSINLGLPAIPEVDDPNLYMALLPIYSALRNVMGAIDQYTGNGFISSSEYSKIASTGYASVQKISAVFVQLTEDVSAGHMINLWNSGGLRARKAASGSTRCHGFATVAGKSGETIPVSLFGLCTSVSGLTPGTDYYLSATAGLVTPTVTSQRLGIALAPTQLWFTP